eukprot:scaffold3596_cov316-Prasinococcus_capsulatus_cf.AAC.12
MDVGTSPGRDVGATLLASYIGRHAGGDTRESALRRRREAAHSTRGVQGHEAAAGAQSTPLHKRLACRAAVASVGASSVRGCGRRRRGSHGSVRGGGGLARR